MLRVLPLITAVGEFEHPPARRSGCAAWSKQGAETTSSFTSINLLTSPLSGFTTNYSFPRVGFDYFATDGFSLGAALGYFTFSGSVEMGDTEVDLDGSSGFLLAPRLGYAAMFSETVGIWPRGGITYVGVSTNSGDSDVESSANRLALSIEAPLVIAPVPHMAITLAPTLDLGLSGSTEVTDSSTGMTQEGDVTATEFGAQAGILVWF